MQWKDVTQDGYPEEDSYVLISIGGDVGIAHFVDGDWDTIGSSRKHFLFNSKERSYSSAQVMFWATLPEGFKE